MEKDISIRGSALIIKEKGHDQHTLVFLHDSLGWPISARKMMLINAGCMIKVMNVKVILSICGFYASSLPE